MRTRKMLLAAGLALATAMTPASAGESEGEGHNTGDQGVVSWLHDTAAGLAQAQCEYHQQTTPNGPTTVLVVEGHAHNVPRGIVRAISTVVRCRITGYDEFGQLRTVMDFTKGIEGSQGAWVGPYTEVEQVTAFNRVCGASFVTWENGSTSGTPNLDTAPVSSVAWSCK